MRKQQSGVMLLEALIAVLIFSIGVLGIVGLQASSISASRDAKFRADAGLLANDLVGQMYASDRMGTTLQTNFQGDGDDAQPASVITDGPEYTAWLQRVSATLPGVLANPPQVTIVPGLVGPPSTSSVVNIVVRWQAPNDLVAHSYWVVANVL